MTDFAIRHRNAIHLRRAKSILVKLNCPRRVLAGEIRRGMFVASRNGKRCLGHARPKNRPAVPSIGEALQGAGFFGAATWSPPGTDAGLAEGATPAASITRWSAAMV